VYRFDRFARSLRQLVNVLGEFEALGIPRITRGATRRETDSTIASGDGCRHLSNACVARCSLLRRTVARTLVRLATLIRAPILSDDRIVGVREPIKRDESTRLVRQLLAERHAVLIDRRDCAKHAQLVGVRGDPLDVLSAGRRELRVAETKRERARESRVARASSTASRVQLPRGR
jgi:hypothetical protein